MKYYTKKPIPVPAIQLIRNAESIRECLVFMGQTVTTTSNIAAGKFHDYCDSLEKGIHIKTMESDGETQLAKWGDYILKGIQGEFYPCDPDVFIATYEEVPD